MSKKGTKLSLGEFLGPNDNAGGGGVGSLPTGPKARGPDDDGSFRRGGGGRGDRPGFRSEQSDNWRRSGSGNYNDNNNIDDRGGGGNWRGAGGGGGRGGDGGGGGNDGGGWRSGGGDRGGGRYNDRGGGGGGRLDDTGGGNWRTGGGGDRGNNRSDDRDRNTPAAASTGERPRLQLKQRSVPMNQGVISTNKKPTEVTPTKTKEKVASENSASSPVASPSRFVKDEQSTEDKRVDDENNTIPRREPEIINSRAAALESSMSANRTKDNKSYPVTPDRGPPPIRNKRFEQLAEGEREKNRDRDTRRAGDGPPPVANSRFAAAADADRSGREERGPPPVANSRFAAAAEADRSSRDRDDRGPPPVANSRFAAAADADRSYRSAAEDDTNDRRGNAPSFRNDRGPPPMANSRFAQAAAMAEDNSDRRNNRRGGERDTYYNDSGDRGGALPQNSRFAAAAAADSDYVDKEERDRRSMDQRERGDGRENRYNYRGGGDRDRYQGGEGFGGRDFDRSTLPTGPRSDRDDHRPTDLRPPAPVKANELLKPKAPLRTDNILKLPDAVALEHSENVLKLPTKARSKDKDDDVFVIGKREKSTFAPKSEPVAEPSQPVPSNNNSEELIAEFISGNKLGDELKQWVEENKDALPPVEKLVFEMLYAREKLNPDPECAWAEPSKYGAALLALVSDNIVNQMQVLWGIQFYCDKLGFPKLNDESVVQSMFRAMYKYDLADSEAFMEWKEDESDEHQKGKMTTIIQTVEWFNWLEADDDDGEEEDDYE